jgi:hypothetical protein
MIHPIPPLAQLSHYSSSSFLTPALFLTHYSSFIIVKVVNKV